MVTKQVAVVGGGLAGAMCADTLASKGIQVCVMDMGRRATGGRASVRYTQEGYFFNHGLQFMKFQNDKLLKRATDWEKSGAIFHWQGEHGCFDATTGTYNSRSTHGFENNNGFCSFLEPGKLWVNNGVTEHILGKHENIKVCLGTVVNSLTFDSSTNHWNLDGKTFGEEKGLGSFDAVVFSDAMTGRKGSPGYVLLDREKELGTVFPVLDRLKVKPIFSLMIALPPGTVESGFDAASVVGSEAFQWISLENNKPNYSSKMECQCFMALSTFDYAEKLLLQHPQQRNFKFVEQTSQYLDPIQEALTREFERLVAPLMSSDKKKAGDFDPLYVKAQRWGGAFYANSDSNGDLCYVDSEKKLALCGDFCADSSTAEMAMLSGLHAGEAIAKVVE